MPTNHIQLFKVSNYILQFYKNKYQSESNNDLEIFNFLKNSLTSLRFQKTLYFLQGLYFSKNNELLFNEQFKAWKYGPVIDFLYIQNKEAAQNKKQLIQIMDLDQFSQYQFTKEDYSNIDFIEIDNILIELDKISTWNLVKMSHVENSPWAQTHLNEIIKNKLIKDYFKDLQLA